MATAVKEQANLERVTDHVEETELDSSRVEQAMTALAAAEDSNGAQVHVQILKEDIELLVNELDVTKQQAESLLRASGGSVAETLRNYLRS